jgi:circadian clock protein KaiC
MPEERFLTVQLHELLTYLGQKRVLTFLVAAQHGLVGSHIESPIDASYLADSVLLFRHFEAAGEVRRALSVMKKRRSGHERSIRELRLTSSGIQVGEPLREYCGLLTGTPVLMPGRLADAGRGGTP